MIRIGCSREANFAALRASSMPLGVAKMTSVRTRPRVVAAASLRRSVNLLAILLTVVDCRASITAVSRFFLFELEGLWQHQAPNSPEDTVLVHRHVPSASRPDLRSSTRVRPLLALERAVVLRV